MYLFKSTSPGVQDYLCNRLYTLPEVEVERYLSQLCQLCVSRPGSNLERVLVDLCAQSLRLAVKVRKGGREKAIASSIGRSLWWQRSGGQASSSAPRAGQLGQLSRIVWPQLPSCPALPCPALPCLQTYWLLLAISQDQPKNTHVASLRDWCEQAALEGHWDLPFRASKLALSPVRSRTSLTTNGGLPLSPEPLRQWGHLKPSQLLALDRTPECRRLSSFDGRPLSPDVPSRPMSPDGLGGGLFSTVFMDTGVEGLMMEEPPDLRALR